jgi:hypothetical protein
MSNEPFFFVVPLKAKSASADWPLVEWNLKDTLRSVRASTSKNYRVVICGHDRPACAEGEDVVFLQAEFSPPNAPERRVRDMRIKLQQAAAWVKAHAPAWVMWLDADDMVSRHLVAFAEQSRAGAILIDQGYRLDVATGGVETRRGDMHERAGSTFILRARPEDLPDSHRDRESLFWQLRFHKTRPCVARRAGRSVEPAPFPAVIYKFNHSESLEFGKRGMRGSIKRSALPDQLLEHFPHAGGDTLEGYIAACEARGVMPIIVQEDFEEWLPR